ncbi:SOS response-associated peptidase [Ralstonia insidiosa]|uniref:Abasic site processing protein n=1 Tax=Ralstonia insidiosa TaxID=190721 RepID=A0A848P2K0_9RALS|nr:SOS response-associated peptidase family protein [Ralstonia insidiosa]NMV39860.1 hypothetical protein [Ralstonia insidiosa]
MCNDYTPSKREAVADLFDLEPPEIDWSGEAFQDRTAPIIRLNEAGRRECLVGTFGFVPQKHKPPAVKRLTTMNARAETLGEKRTFAPYWRKGNVCLLPASSVFEPNYEANGPSGPSIRYRIWLRDQADFAIAGMWRDWRNPDGSLDQYSFTLITLNADEHPVFNRMHKPFEADGVTPEEKRGVVMLHREFWDDWLACRDPDRARTFLNLYPASLMDCEPAPVPPRKKKLGGLQKTGEEARLGMQGQSDLFHQG